MEEEEEEGMASDQDREADGSGYRQSWASVLRALGPEVGRERRTHKSGTKARARAQDQDKREAKRGRKAERPGPGQKTGPGRDGWEKGNEPDGAAKRRVASSGEPDRDLSRHD